MLRKKKKTTKSSKLIKKPILQTRDLPANQSMLDLTEKKIKFEIHASEKRLESKINQVESKINQVESKINQVESKINKVESKINQVESKMEMVFSEIQRVALLMEEQNSRNKFVLDGYAGLVEKIDSNEASTNEKIKLLESVILKKPLNN